MSGMTAYTDRVPERIPMFLRFAGKMTLTATALAILSCGLLQHFYPTMSLHRELFLSAIWGLFLFLTLATALA